MRENSSLGGSGSSGGPLEYPEEISGKLTETEQIYAVDEGGTQKMHRWQQSCTHD